MTEESSSRSEIVGLALVVSVVIHVALMFFMKPQVMTHVSGADARSRARGPMRVRESVPPPDTVRLETVADVSAQREAPAAEVDDLMPETEVVVAGADSPSDVPPPDFSPAEVPKVKEMTVENAPMLSVPIHVGEEAAKFTSPTVAENPLLYTPTAGSAPPPSPIAPDDVGPDIPAPEVKPGPLSDVADVFEPGSDFKDPTEPPRKVDDFVPVSEVMSEVDERVVEQEKSAVRGLLDVREARDLSSLVNVVGSSAEADGWTYFRLQISPDELQTDSDKALPVVSKDVVILIDASGSIANDRLRSCREAAKEILRTCMNSGDRFNLVAFRDRFEYAFKSWRDCDRDSYKAAESWMDRLAAHGRTDVFATIASVLTLPRDPKRPLVALVVTDGDANAGVRETSQILSRFTALNDGLVSVYMYGVKGTANRELIDVLTRGNRGESFIHEGDRKFAGRSIGELSERFRDPVLTDLRVVFTAASKAEALPARLKNLYKGEVIEVVGRAPKGTKEVSFSLKGLNGERAYEGFFRVNLVESSFDAGLPKAWGVEKNIDRRLGVENRK